MQFHKIICTYNLIVLFKLGKNSNYEKVIDLFRFSPCQKEETTLKLANDFKKFLPHLFQIFEVEFIVVHQSFILIVNRF